MQIAVRVRTAGLGIVLAAAIGCGSEPAMNAGFVTPMPTAGKSSTPTAGMQITVTAGVVSMPPPTSGSMAMGTSGMPAPKAGSSGMAAATSGSGGKSGATGGASGAAGSGMMGAGMCCSDGDCLCHGDAPSAPTNMPGPFKTAMYDLASAGCVYYPMDAQPPFAAVAISDGFGGSGGCGLAQTGNWGPLYASWGIVAMIIHTGAGDQPQVRGTKLTAAITAYKMENTKADSPLNGKLSGRYGTSGFSMGGGGTTFAAMADPMLKTDVAIMAWTPATSGIMVPSLFIFGSADTLAGTMGMGGYRSITDPTPKMAVTIPSPHSGQPGDGGGLSGQAGLAFQKVYLEGDERWRAVLHMVKADDMANIE